MSEISKKISEFVDKLAKDWDKLPGFFKFCFLLSAFTLLSGWVANDQQQKFLSLSLTGWIYITLIVFAFIFPSIYWFSERLYIFRIKQQYPLKNMGHNFKFLKVGDSAFIVSEGRRKHIRWIENPRTLYDMGFSTYWLEDEYSCKESFEKLIKQDYKVKRGLRSHGKPGSLKDEQW
jgi:hypothetical protein